MPAPNPLTTLRLPASVKRHLEVATAGAWEALTEAHAEEALRLVALVSDEWSFDEAIDYYFSEVGLTGTQASGIRNRALVRLEEEDRLDITRPSMHLSGKDEDEDEGDDESEGWSRFRPDRLVKELRQRQRKAGETERWAQLALAQAEEAIIAVHVDNAMDFVALLEPHMSLERSVAYYVDALGVSGCRAQTIVQRSMASLADAILQPHERPRGGVARG